jgi:hypothetical protein
MQYTEEQLIKIGEFAGLLMTITDIAILMDFDEDELRLLIQDKSHEVSKVYHLHKTQTILSLRRQEIELGKAGSTIGIELTQKYMLEQTLNENG